MTGPHTTLVPDARSHDHEDATRALAAPVLDPLWMLARQWQTTELHAEDGGTAVGLELSVDAAHFKDVLTAAGTVAIDPARVPLQLDVDAERVPELAERPLEALALAGVELLRTLEDHGAGAARGTFAGARYRLAIDEAQWQQLEPSSRRRLRPWRDRVPDPRLVVAELAPTLGTDGTGPGPLPALSGLSASLSPTVAANLEAGLRDWIHWLDPQPKAGPSSASWSPERLESTFALSAETAAARVRLRAPEHLGGELDWYSFVRSQETVVPPPQPPPPLRLLPAPISYPGMPLPRHWELEDGGVNLDAVVSGRDDPGPRALLAFVHQHANDWFSVPVELPTGSITLVRSLFVIDSFGDRLRIPAMGELDGVGGAWQMFSVSPDPELPGAVDPAGPLVLVHSAGRHLTGPVLEDVLLLRDEMANLAWAVERITPDLSGQPIDRLARYLRLRPPRPGNDTLASPYRLGSTVPDHWYPLESSADAAGTWNLRVSSLPGAATGVSDDGVRGTVIDHTEGATIRDEEVPREGANVTRRRHRARWIDGSTRSWLARAKRVGLGEGSSGLRFDYLDEVGGTLALTRSSDFAAEVLADRPFAYLRLAEPEGATAFTDGSGRGNHATMVGGGITVGVVGLGAGDTGVRFENPRAGRLVVRDRGLLSPRHLTIEALVAWFGATGDTQQRILERSTDDTGWMASYGLSVLPSGNIRVELTTESAEPFLTSAAVLVPDAPTHLAATYDGQTLALYVNGILDSSLEVGGALRPLAAQADLAVGNQAQSSRARAFSGIIDEIALYDRALSPQSVATHVAAAASQLGNLVRNPHFAIARPGKLPPVTGPGGDRAAAEEWYLWNNAPVTSTSELVPTTRPGVTGNMLRVTTGSGSCGLVQAWRAPDSGPATVAVAAWVYVVYGSVMLGCGNGGNTGEDVTSTGQGRWELLEAPNGVSPANEVIVYAKDPAGAEYFVDEVSVRV